MKAIFSLITPPLIRTPRYATFPTFVAFLQSWSLAVNQAAKFFNEIELYTDDFGKELLVDYLQLPFTATKQIPSPDNNYMRRVLWVYGKLWAYHDQTSPFIHLDSDVFLWKPLPERILNSKICCQSEETNIFAIRTYTKGLKAICRHMPVRPVEWVPSRDHIRNQWSTAMNAGIFGGHPEYIKMYTNELFNILNADANQPGWAALSTYQDDTIHGSNLIIEQYLSAYLFHKSGVWPDVTPLLQEMEIFGKGVDHSRNVCREVGYTHLLDFRAKNDPSNVARLNARMQKDYPETHQRTIDAVDHFKEFVQYKERQLCT